MKFHQFILVTVGMKQFPSIMIVSLEQDDKN